MKRILQFQRMVHIFHQVSLSPMSTQRYPAERLLILIAIVIGIINSLSFANDIQNKFHFFLSFFLSLFRIFFLHFHLKVIGRKVCMRYLHDSTVQMTQKPQIQIFLIKNPKILKT